MSYTHAMTRSFIAIMIAALLSLTLAQGAVASTSSAHKIRSAALAYHKAQVDHHWRDACKMLSRKALADQGGLSGCIANFSTNGFDHSTMTVYRVTVRPSGWKGTAYTYLNGTKADKWILTFVRENGVYKLDHDRS